MTPDEEIMPPASIPERERLVWENEQVRASLTRGLQESANGETVELEDFIADHEQDLRDVREGIQEALFIIAVIALFVWGCWVFA